MLAASKDTKKSKKAYSSEESQLSPSVTSANQNTDDKGFVFFLKHTT